LDDLVLQDEDAERPLATIGFGNVDSAYWQRSIAAAVDTVAEVPKILVELLCVR
jgi:hypothetical protein